MQQPLLLDDEYLMTSHVARELKVSNSAVLLFERTGKLKSIRASNGFRLFSRADVERLKKERRKK